MKYLLSIRPLEKTKTCKIEFSYFLPLPSFQDFPWRFSNSPTFPDVSEKDSFLDDLPDRINPVID